MQKEPCNHTAIWDRLRTFNKIRKPQDPQSNPFQLGNGQVAKCAPAQSFVLQAEMLPLPMSLVQIKTNQFILFYGLTPQNLFYPLQWGWFLLVLVFAQGQRYKQNNRFLPLINGQDLSASVAIFGPSVAAVQEGVVCSRPVDLHSPK